MAWLLLTAWCLFDKPCSPGMKGRPCLRSSDILFSAHSEAETPPPSLAGLLKATPHGARKWSCPHTDPWGCSGWSHAASQDLEPHRKESRLPIFKEGFFCPRAGASDARQLSANDVKGGGERVQGPQVTLSAFFLCLASLSLLSGLGPKLSC